MASETVTTGPASKSARAGVDCLNCPLAQCADLIAPGEAQRAWIQAFKSGEVAFARGEQVLRQGARPDRLYTVLAGVLMRFRLLEDGRRQIINFMFPGDLIGLQAAFDADLAHGIEAITDARLCVFPRARFFDLVVAEPRLAYDITWLAACEEAALEDHLVSLGQRSARERMVYLATFLVERGMQTGVAEGAVLHVSITQSQVADMLGLSLVHTNRTMQTLRRAGLVDWTLASITVPDIAAARAFARLDPQQVPPRPFI